MASKKRLISLDDVLQKLLIDAAESKGIIRSLILDVVDYLKKQPVIDAVEVVRCKDCKNGRQPWLEGQTMVKCMVGKGAIVTPEHFCSYGERKDNADL